MKMNNKGFTLVEVMAGFSLLVVLMVSFVKIIKLSSDLTNAAVEMRNNNTDFYETYYSGENYYVNGKTAFRKTKENSINLSIEIKEYSSGSFEEVLDGSSFVLNNVKIKKIENINDISMAKNSVFRYVRTK